MKKLLLSAILIFSLAFLFAQGNITKAAWPWEVQISGVTDPLTSVSFATDSIGLVGGYDGGEACTSILKRTSDMGTTWEDAGTVPTFSCGMLDDADVSTYLHPNGQVYAAAVFNASMGGWGHYFSTDDLEGISGIWDDTDTGGTHHVHGVKQVDTTTIYQVGSEGGMSVIMKNSTSLTNTDALAATLYDIDCTAENTCWAVGGGGNIAYTGNGTSFTGGIPTGVTAQLNGVDMVSSALGYAVGESGSVLKCSTDNCVDEGDWVDLSTGIAEDLNSISCTDVSTCWVVGASGAIYKTDDGGTSWDSETSGVATALNGVDFYSPGRGWIAGASGVILAQLDETAPVTTADPAGGTYTEAQTVTLSAEDSESGVDATYYTTDGTDPTTGSSVYSTSLEISETTTLKFFSVDNAGNEESVNTEEYTINITPTPEPTPEPTPTDTTEDYAGGELKIKDIELDKTYHNTKNNTDFYFYRKPTRKFSVRKKLYIKILRKSGYKKAFKRKKAFKTHYRLELNAGKAKKDTWPNVKKRMKYKVALRYTDAQLVKKQGIKEKNLRLFIKDRKNLWRGPYTVYQNRSTNTFKFKIRNFKHLNELASISSTNRTFSPTFYFRDLKKVRFVIATKKAFRKNYPFNLADQNNYDFE